MRPKVIANCTRALAKGGANRGIRLGARPLSHFRKVRVLFGKSYGHCEVVFEPGTKVYAQVSATIGEPMDSRPGEGVFTVSVWISPTATGDMMGSSQKPALIARTIERLFKENKAVDLESLCIRFGEKAWILRADIHIIDMNGCLQESAALAVLGALLSFRRPNAYMDPDTNQLVLETIEECTPIKLHLFHLPILTSFALCNGILLAEPNHEEEEIFPGKLVIGLNDSKELCYLHTTNVIAEDILLEATKLAQAKCIERANWIKELATKYIDHKNIPVYEKEIGPRTTGTVVSISEAEQKLPSLSELSHLIIPSGSSSSSKNSGGKTVKKSIPNVDLSHITVLEDMV